jgi:glycosidase
MKAFPVYPLIYELNAITWLNDLSRKYNKHINLSNVPEAEWDTLKMHAVDVIWLMGVWKRSPEGTRIAKENQGLMDGFRRVLPDLKDEDISGSHYCVKADEVDLRMGGKKGREKARQALKKRGMGLFLDFVPNHTAPDNEWTTLHPEFYIKGKKEDADADPSSWMKIGKNVIARAKDPYYPAWPDVVQVNAFNTGYRKMALETLRDIASQCDGVRCDMAMLMCNPIFEKTWRKRAGKVPNREFWPDIINNVKADYPEFRFVAEVYWDMEWELQQQGFDFCYDKRLYDRLTGDTAESIRLHLGADLFFQNRLLRFIENHDEERVAAILEPAREKAAMVAVMSLPGARLLHEGQNEGCKIKLPVFLGRRPAEHVDQDLHAFYKKLLKIVDNNTFKNGKWTLLKAQGWNGDESARNILAWSMEDNEERYLIVINFHDGTSRARLILPWYDLMGKDYILDDVMSGNYYERNGDQLKFHGLFVELGPWQYHFFHFTLL